MPQFIDISNYTETVPSGDEFIQISASQKASLREIAKLAAPDDVPNNTEVDTAITDALTTFKEQEIDPINETIGELTPVENKFITNATTGVTISAGDIVNCTSSSNATPISVIINVSTFTTKSNTALVIANGNKVVQFSISGSTGSVYKAEFPDITQDNASAKIAYAIQLVDNTNKLFLVNACLYKA